MKPVAKPNYVTHLVGSSDSRRACNKDAVTCSSLIFWDRDELRSEPQRDAHLRF